MIFKVLGSVSPYCKENLNCPGYLVKKGDTKILLDCGNGISRLLRFPDDLKKMTVIISHLHKDHYGDLSVLGYASYVYHNLGLLDNRIKVYIPKDDELFDFSYLMNFGNENFLEFITYSEDSILDISGIMVSFHKTLHPVLTYAVNLVYSSWKISYSSDTGFDKHLIPFVSNADLFICESTYLSEQKRDNIYHLTAYEAGLLAKSANVKKLLLTNFWPESDKNLYKMEASLVFSDTLVAVEGELFTDIGK